MNINTPKGFFIRDKRLTSCNNQLGQAREALIKNFKPPYEETIQKNLDKISKQQSELVLRYRATLSRYLPNIK